MSGDPRTLRSKQLRWTLFQSTDGLCAICGERLGDDWEADHIEPWSVTKTTNVHGMQPLCRSCNRRKGASMEGSTTVLDKSAFRFGQREAFGVIMKRIEARCSTTAIVLPTRYGKSDLIRCVAFQGRMDGLVGGSLALSPAEFLTRQMVDGEKVKAMADRYSMQPLREVMNLRQASSYEHDPFAMGEYLLACNIQLALQQNIKWFRDLARRVMDRFGAPLCIHIDECHEVSAKLHRGSFVEEMIDAGALAVLYTATPIRADGEQIPGFEQEVLDEKDARRFVATRIAEDLVQVDVYEGRKTLTALKAHHETTFREAWNERPSPLCRLSREVVDVDLEDSHGEATKLSELSVSAARKEIGFAVRSGAVIRDGVKKMLTALYALRQVEETCSAIVFTGGDRSGEEDNAHAKVVRGEIERQDSTLDVVIATMKNNSAKSNQTIAEKIGKFASGRGDVLIVKNAGGAGLDCPRLKVMLDLSSTRTVAAVIQRLMRVATPFDGIRVGTVITLQDPMMQAIWDGFIVDQGGAASAADALGAWSISDMELVKRYTKKPEDKPEERHLAVIGAALGALDDSHGVIGNPNHSEQAEELIRLYPGLIENNSKAQLTNVLAGLYPGAVCDAQKRTTMLTRGERIEKQREQFNEATKAYAQFVTGGYRGPGDRAWADTMKQIVTDAKLACGLGSTSGGLRDKLPSTTSITDDRLLSSMADYVWGRLEEAREHGRMAR